MARTKPLSLGQRIDKLKDLIRDAKDLGFKHSLILGFQKQLTILEKEADTDQQKKIVWRKNDRKTRIM